MSQVIAWCRNVCGVALTPASSAYFETICWTRRVENLPCRLGLEDPSIVRVGCDVGSQRRGEALAEQDVAILAALAQVDPDLAGFEVNIGDSEVAEFADPHRRVEEQPAASEACWTSSARSTI